MQISQVTKQELALLIYGLKAIYVADAENIRERLLKQLENELSTRYNACLE